MSATVTETVDTSLSVGADPTKVESRPQKVIVAYLLEHSITFGELCAVRQQASSSILLTITTNDRIGLE
ncbi:hypothetical protein V8C42DRAFT_322826 [Trichoderma barbatum]